MPLHLPVEEGSKFDRICWDFQDLKPIHLFLPVTMLCLMTI